MRVHLTWTGPEGDGEWSGDLPVVIGREGELVISDAQLSRQHARLEASGDDLLITDLGSSNGTTVSGALVEHALLPPDGRFALGRVEMQATAVAPPAPPEAATVRVDPNATVRVDAAPVLPEVPQIVVTITHVETGDTSTVRHKAPFTMGKRDDCEVVLEDTRVSRHHATVSLDASGGAFEILVTDEGSSNGTFVGGSKTETARLGTSGEIEIRPFRIGLVLEGIAAEPEGGSERVQPQVPQSEAQPPVTPYSTHGAPPPLGATIETPEASGVPDPFASVAHGVDPRDGAALADEDASIVFDAESPGPVAVARNFPPALFDGPVVPVAALQQDGRPILEADYVAIGGGLGNFVWVDMLRIGGVPASRIAVLGLEPKPHSRYERLCINSQIPEHERLRSDSGSCPDNIWGWPGYAVREAWKETFRGSLGTAANAVWKIFNEPTFATTYTPRSGEVFDSIDVEAARIGWDQMRHPARVRAIRKTDDGRYAIAYTVPTDEPDRERYALARFAHVAVGYPGIRLLPDLQEYRQNTRDTTRVVNAYEEHEHVYDKLGASGGTVVLRGWGIVASRIIQTLWELRRDRGADIRVLHLTRSIVSEGHSFRGSQRETDNNWEFQPFNWPKACWGGDLRFLLEGAGPADRAELLKLWGGTTTADREDWRQMVVQGLGEGWYQIREGVVDHVEPGPGDTVRTVIVGKKTIQAQSQLDADFILDCTGLVSTIDSHPLLKDLVEHHGLSRNVQGRLDVANDFEIRGMRNAARGAGRIYAAGVATLGGPYAPVDSFLGLQYSAQRSIDAMERARAPYLRHLNVSRSLSQWIKWARRRSPDGGRPVVNLDPRDARRSARRQRQTA